MLTLARAVIHVYIEVLDHSASWIRSTAHVVVASVRSAASGLLDAEKEEQGNG